VIVDTGETKEDLKAAWSAAPPFPIASKPKDWKSAVTLALQAATPKEKAQTYIRFGVPVIPCNPIESGENSKRPYVSSTKARLTRNRSRLGGLNTRTP
jgi:hypothetical protein